MKRTHWLLCGAAWLGACSVTIEGEQQQRDDAAAAGARAQWDRPFAARGEAPPPSSGAPLADWIAFAEQHNGEIEAAWHAWCAAIEQVPQAATQDTTAMVGVSHRLDGGAFLDRSALTLASDAMNNLLLPGRLQDRGREALAGARAAGARFVQSRLRLQREVAERYHELALHEREIALQERLRTVIAAAVPSQRARVAAGTAMQRDLLQAELALLAADRDLARLHAEHPGMVRALSALAGIAAATGDEPRPRLEPLQALLPSEADAVQRALTDDPAVAVRRREHEQTLAAITVAEWRRVPEFSLQAMLGGDGVVALAGALTLPFLRDHAIDAAVRQAAATARAAEAMQRQAGADAIARAVAALAALRAAADQDALLQQEQAKAATVAELARTSFATGGGTFADWAAAESARIGLEVARARLAADAAVARARLLESLGGRT